MAPPRPAFLPPLPALRGAPHARPARGLTRHAAARPAAKHARPRAPRAQFNPQPHLPPPPTNRAPDYYANVGTVIDTLRADYPHLLSRTPDMQIYADELTFADGSGYRIYGKEAYKTVLWLVRAQARLFLTSAYVEIQSLYHDDSEGAVYLRWRVSAIPRWSGMGRCVVDGMSVYRLNRRGLVYEHCLENAARRRGVRPMFEGVLAVGKVRVEGRVIGAGVGAGGVPGWYRSVFEPCEFVALEHVEMEEDEESKKGEREVTISSV